MSSESVGLLCSEVLGLEDVGLSSLSSASTVGRLGACAVGRRRRVEAFRFRTRPELEADMRLSCCTSS